MLIKSSLSPLDFNELLVLFSLFFVVVIVLVIVVQIPPFVEPETPVKSAAGTVHEQVCTFANEYCST